MTDCLSSQKSVVVVMPVFNAAGQHLQETIESILNQDYEEFAFIIVDDGSFDDTSETVKRYSSKDERITLIRHESNQGIAEAMNTALSFAASSEFIAVMDAGDIANRSRLSSSIKFLLDQPDHVLVASQAAWIDNEGNTLRITNYQSDDDPVRRHLLTKNNIIVHPTVMFRNRGMRYRSYAGGATDYDFILRMSQLGKIHILDEVLASVRFNPFGTTYSAKFKQIRAVDLVFQNFAASQKGEPEVLERLPELKWFELLQEKWFRYFSQRAVLLSMRSRFLYLLMRGLSGIVAPQYIWWLFVNVVRLRIKI